MVKQLLLRVHDQIIKSLVATKTRHQNQPGISCGKKFLRENENLEIEEIYFQVGGNEDISRNPVKSDLIFPVEGFPVPESGLKMEFKKKI